MVMDQDTATRQDIANEPSFHISARKLSETIKSENGGLDAARFINRIWTERSSRPSVSHWRLSGSCQ